MRKGLTLIELLVVVAIACILGAIAFGIVGSGCNGVSTSYNRNLKFESMENTGWQTKYHWTDLNSGEHFYSLSRDGGTLYPE